MDLDYEELEATRRLNRVVIESNSIQIIQDFIDEIRNFELNKDTIEITNALEDILAEREADKKKIKELEVLEDDLKDKRVVYIDTPEFAENYIPIQKVKDVIKDIKLSGGSNGKDDIENLVRELIIDVLEELLEDK